MIVYLYTNKVNGKQYIGQTIRSFNDRHKQHLRCNDTHFDRALAKYGEDSFEWEILYIGSSKENLNQKEIELIQKYNTVRPNGYNIPLGGNSFHGYKITKKHRENLSKALKKYYKNNPNAMKGENSPQYGVVWSDERKESMSEIKKSFWNNNDKARDEMSKIKKQFYKDNPDALVAMGERTRRWTAENGSPVKGMKHTTESRKRMSEAQKGKVIPEETREKIRKNSTRKRSVINIDTGEIFDTVREASESVGKNKSSISNVCRGVKNTSGGYRWSYLDEYKNEKEQMDMLFRNETGRKRV